MTGFAYRTSVSDGANPQHAGEQSKSGFDGFSFGYVSRNELSRADISLFVRGVDVFGLVLGLAGIVGRASRSALLAYDELCEHPTSSRRLTWQPELS
jgi:hypothetical protein